MNTTHNSSYKVESGRRNVLGYTAVKNTNKVKKKKHHKTSGINGSAWSVFWLIFPFASLFFIFIVLPVFVSALLSLTYYNAIDAPRFVGIQNYVDMFTRDREFMMYVVPQTLKFAIIVGPGGYVLSFLFAWMLAQLPRGIRTVLALVIYTPSLAGLYWSYLEIGFLRRPIWIFKCVLNEFRNYQSTDCMVNKSTISINHYYLCCFMEFIWYWFLICLSFIV